MAKDCIQVKEFLNKRKQKGDIEGPGQSNSNLWFTTFEKPDGLGPNTASGSVWLNEEISANEPSEPFLFAGWEKRCAWIQNDGETAVDFIFETDKTGNGNWDKLETVEIESGEAKLISFTNDETGEWIRVVTNKKTRATVSFNYSDEDNRKTNAAKIFTGLANIKTTKCNWRTDVRIR